MPYQNLFELKKDIKKYDLTWKSIRSHITPLDRTVKAIVQCRIGGREFMIINYNNGKPLDIFPHVSSDLLNFDFIKRQ